MKHFDYQLLQALAMIMQEQSFDRAAQQLHITQSAISQRIKQLEQMVAQPVLIRSSPLQLTALGQLLLGHYQQVVQLERDIWPQVAPEADHDPIRVSMAVNADSLATWFIPALAPLLESGTLELNLIIQDENWSIERLRHGEVFGAVTTQARAVAGCQSDCLGTMDYVLAASPGFVARYFAEGLTLDALRRAPAVGFDARDDMHASFLQLRFGISPGEYPCHTVRSSETFVAMALAGVAYCLIPRLQIATQLAQHLLVDVLPDAGVARTLYWQRWILERGLHRQISQQIMTTAQQFLQPQETLPDQPAGAA